MIPKIHSYISGLSKASITEERKKKLQVLIDCISNQIEFHEPIRLNFICTHNSRRSQLAQIWAQTMANYFNLNIESFSGGVEVTQFNENAISTLKRIGFSIEVNGTDNPHYFVQYTKTKPALEMFSKIYDDPFNYTENFIAVMTCSDADTNCPVISGAKKRISLTYIDPKEYDGTDLQDQKYDEISLKIATELYYVFSKFASD
jgi:arsenate reductase